MTDAIHDFHDNKKAEDPQELFYDTLKASSTTDCTGVMYRAPSDSQELDSYLEVYPFLPQAALAATPEAVRAAERDRTMAPSGKSDAADERQGHDSRRPEV